MSYKRIELPYMDAEIVADEIGDFILERITAIGNTGAVIGLSGGVDSTVTAALAQRAFERYNKANAKKLELIGYILPSKVNDPKDAEDGLKVADRLGIRREVIGIEQWVDAARSTNSEAFIKNYDRGNLMSRIRANILNTKAATESKTLLGTGNKDEDFGLGYYTMFGDGAVHMSPIGNLSKRLVKEMATYLGFNEAARRTPTAGLEPGQTDFKDLGYQYELAELVLEGISQDIKPGDLYKHPQITVMFTEEYVDLNRFRSLDLLIEDILRRHDRIALPKTQIIHPPMAKVTLRYR